MGAWGPGLLAVPGVGSHTPSWRVLLSAHFLDLETEAYVGGDLPMSIPHVEAEPALKRPPGVQAEAGGCLGGGSRRRALSTGLGSLGLRPRGTSPLTLTVDSPAKA